MNISNAHERLFSLWGIIDKQHNELICARVSGNKVLDVGCGYGTLTNLLTEKGYNARGIDFDDESIKVAKSLFPDADIEQANAESLEDYEGGSFDTVILKDCLHHLVGEGDVKAAFASFRRLLKEGGRVVILDPNPMLILRVARKIAFHKDPEATLDKALCILDEEGFAVKGVEFYETVGLPLSGGYVGVRMVPNLAFCNNLAAAANKGISALVNKVGLGRQLCWRYLIHADTN